MKNFFPKRTEYVFSGEIEMDEVYFSAGKKGEHILDRKSRVRGLKQRGRGTYNSNRPLCFRYYYSYNKLNTSFRLY